MQPLIENIKYKQSIASNSSINQRKAMNNFTLASLNTPSQRKPQILPNLVIKNSCVYSTIKYMYNPSRQFISYYSISNQYKSLRNTDTRILIYFSAISKLFGELKGMNGRDEENKHMKAQKQFEYNNRSEQKIDEGIDMKDIWVCENKTTGYPILAYFTQPAKYAVMECCYKPIYIQFEYQLSGLVKCSNCNKVAFSFVHLSKSNPKPNRTEKRLKIGSLSQNLNRIETQAKASKMEKRSKEQKQKNKDQQREREKQKQKNEKIYKLYKQAYSQKRNNVRKLVSSNQHRYKPLINCINNDITSLVLKGTGNDSLGKENLSIQDIRIGEFVIEITEINNTENTNKNKENEPQDQKKQNWQIQAQDRYYDKYLNEYENMSSNCKQTRAIILQLFK